MSAGRFILSTYEADSGSIHQIKLQPETVLATFGGTANTAPTAAVDSPFAAQSKKGPREYGLGARFVNVEFEDDVPEGYRPYTTIPIVVLDPTVYDGINPGDAVVYAGGNGEVSSKGKETLFPGSTAIGTTAVAPDSGSTEE